MQVLTHGDKVRYSFDSAPAGMSIDQNGRIVWATTPDDISEDEYDAVVRVTNSFGQSATQNLHITVEGDTQAPAVSVRLSNNHTPIGSSVTILVQAADNVGVTTRTLLVDGVAVILDANGSATLPFEDAGNIDVVADAYDAAGNHGTASVVLNVFDPSDTDPPVVSIGSVGDDSNLLKAITSVVGSVSDPDDNIIEWSLELIPKDGGKTVTVATGTDDVDNATLGSIDTTNLRNGLYTLLLSATDAGGNVATATRELEISADLKLGNYTVSFTDLSVAVGGMSIVVSRSYNTLNADKEGEFGYGWSLDLSNTKVEVKYPAGTDGSTAFEGTLPPFRDGTRVIITLPDGKRGGFTFYGAPGTQFFGQVFDWIPKFIPDYGVQTR